LVRLDRRVLGPLGGWRRNRGRLLRRGRRLRGSDCRQQAERVHVALRIVRLADAEIHVRLRLGRRSARRHRADRIAFADSISARNAVRAEMQ
jgi:hypothetical protein